MLLKVLKFFTSWYTCLLVPNLYITCVYFRVLLLRTCKSIFSCDIYCRCVNMKEWNKAVEVYPNYASEDKLKVFFKVKMKTKEGLTQPFKDYCRAALDSVSRKDSENSVDMGGCAGYFISSPYTKSTKEALLSAMPSYQGSTFIIAGNCKQVSIKFTP